MPTLPGDIPDIAPSVPDFLGSRFLCPAIPDVDPAWYFALGGLYPEVAQLVWSLAQGPGSRGPDCGFAAIEDLDYLQVSTVQDQLCRICLGPIEGMGGQLAATLEPGAYSTPSMGPAALWRTLVPDVSDALLRAFSDGIFPDNLNIDFPTSATQDAPGLFFTGGFFEWVVRWAYTLDYGYAGLAARPYNFVADPCNVEEGTIQGVIRDAMSPTAPTVTVWLGADDANRTGWGAACLDGVTTLSVVESGVAELGSIFGTTPPNGFANNAADATNWNAVLHCFGPRRNAARADYYMWWADRLLQSAQATGNSWHAFMAVLCARKGLANVIWVGGQILHEIVHLTTARRGHCAVLNVGTPLDNCTDKAMFTYIHSVYAHLGLPHHSRGDAFASRTWSLYSNGSYEVWVRATHCGLLASDHQVRLEYEWPGPGDAATCRDPAMSLSRVYGQVPPGLWARCPQEDVAPLVGPDADPPQPTREAVEDHEAGAAGCCGAQDHGLGRWMFVPLVPESDPLAVPPVVVLDRSTPGQTEAPLRRFSMLDAVKLDGFDPAVVRRARLDSYLRLDPTRLTATKALDLFVPHGEWRPVGEVTEARGGVEVTGHTGQMQVAPAVQLCTDPEGSLTTVKIALPGGGYAGSDGVAGPATTWTDLGATDKTLLREGWIVRLRSGAVRAWCQASGWIEFRCT